MNTSVKQIFKGYPPHIHTLMMEIRDLIFEEAEKLESAYDLEETLKWGEPSYLIAKGTTIRIDWKESAPEHIGIFFNCQTKLIDTFRAIYGSNLKFEGNRAILLDVDSEIPERIIRECFNAALTYHTRKKLPLLGM